MNLSFEGAFLAVPVGLALATAGGALLSVNRALASYLGVDRERAVGRPLAEFIEPTDRAAAEECLRALRCGECERYDAERRYVHASGSVLFVHESATLVDSGGGAESAVVLQIQDVSGRRRAAKSVHDRETRLRLLLEQVPAVIWTTDTELRFTSGLGRRLDVLDLAPNQNVGTSLWEYFGTQDDEFPAIAAHRRALSGEAATFDQEWLGRVFRTHVEPLRAGDGAAIVGTIGVSSDVTDLKRAEEALRESEARMRAIFDESPVGKALVDRSGGIEEVNDSLCRMMGFAREELVGMDIHRLSRPSDHGRNRRELRRLREGERILQGERRLLRRDGGSGWFRITVSVFPDLGGEPDHRLVTIEDITQQRHSEEEASRQRAELGRVLRLRSMGELAAGLAHELNQPLAAVVNYAKGCVNRLRDGTVTPEELTHKLDQIADEALRAGSVIKWVQRYLRKEAPRRDPADLRALLENIVRLVEAEAERREIEIRLLVPENPPAVSVESVQIEQVVFNLVRNAFDAIQAKGDEGPNAIEIGVAFGAEDVRVSIGDSGRGIGPGDPERLFEPFYSSKSDGMGLGLSISRSIIEAHGGRLRVAAASPAGTTFEFTLPLEASGE
jgi:PAS domain S-box-containing protein